MAKMLKPDSGAGDGVQRLPNDALGSLMSGKSPELRLEADLGGGQRSLPPRSGCSGPHVHRPGCAAAGQPQPLKSSGGEPHPAQLGGCHGYGFALLWAQRPQQCFPVPRKDLLIALVFGGELSAGRERSGCEDRG
jgi:hypothetical protein